MRSPLELMLPLIRHSALRSCGHAEAQHATASASMLVQTTVRILSFLAILRCQRAVESRCQLPPPRRADGTPNVREARRRSDALNIGSSGGDDSRSLHQFSPSVRGPTCSNNTVGHGTWTAEFTSKENCEAAALALKQMVSTGASG